MQTESQVLQPVDGISVCHDKASQSDGVNNSFFSHSSGGWKSKTKVCSGFKFS